MNDNVVHLPGTEYTPAAILRRALAEADKMDAVMIFTVTHDGEHDLISSGLRLSDLCTASVRLQNHAMGAMGALEDMEDGD